MPTLPFNMSAPSIRGETRGNMASVSQEVSWTNPTWNERNLSSPPVLNISQIVIQSNVEHLKNAHRVLEKAATTSSISVQLATEICLLKKYIYKSRSLKSEKFMQSFKQISTCGTRFNETNFLTPLKTLMELWPSTLDVVVGAKVYLPSKPLLQFALVRLLGAAKLLHKIINLAVVCHSYITRKIKLEEHFNIMIVFAANVSRVWMLCRAQKNVMTSCYSKLYPLLEVLQPLDSTWLRDNSKLPENLQTWLGKEIGLKQLQTRCREEKTSTIFDRWTLKDNVDGISDASDSDMEAEENEERKRHLAEDVGVSVKRQKTLQALDMEDIWEKRDSSGIPTEEATQQKDEVIALEVDTRNDASTSAVVSVEHDSDDCKTKTSPKDNACVPGMLHVPKIPLATFDKWTKRIEGCTDYLLVSPYLSSFLEKACIDPLLYKTTCKKIEGLQKHTQWSRKKMADRAKRLAGTCISLLKEHQKENQTIQVFEKDNRDQVGIFSHRKNTPDDLENNNVTDTNIETVRVDHSEADDEPSHLSPDRQLSSLETHNELSGGAKMATTGEDPSQMVKIWERKIDECKSISSLSKLVRTLLTTAGVDPMSYEQQCQKIEALEERAKRLAKKCLKNVNESQMNVKVEKVNAVDTQESVISETDTKKKRRVQFEKIGIPDNLLKPGTKAKQNMIPEGKQITAHIKKAKELSIGKQMQSGAKNENAEKKVQRNTKKTAKKKTSKIK